jgi:hypothetical protein
MTTTDPLAKTIQERFTKLKGDRSSWDTLWSEIARYIIPRRYPGLNGAVMSPGVGNEALLFDTTAIQANLTLANGQLAWTCPIESPWFAYEPQGNASDEAKRWLAETTSIAREELALSSFYTAVHEFFLDRGAFGTACFYIEPGRRSAITAQHWPVGSFVIDEDEDGNVDTVIRELKLTPRQAVMKFGEDKVSPRCREALKDAKRSHEKMSYLHAVYPRADAERDKAKLDGPNMPIASVYLDTECNHVCRSGGYEEMPCMVSRFLEWGSAMNGLYGWSPAFSALPEARQVNFLQKMGDALAEKAAFPPMLIPEDLEGEVDPNANGVTYFSKEMASAGAMPREWQTQGRYDILLNRVKERQEAINRAFHVELFQMFAQIEKQMTAREVAERAQEKLTQFSPTFSRLTSELFNPALERILGILARSGKLGAVPMELAGAPYRVQYSSRIALALRSLPAIGYRRTLERVSAVAAFAPSVLDNYDFDKAERDTALSDGVPPEFMRKESDVSKMREERAAAQAQAQQQAATMQGADALAKVGQIPADSPITNILQANLPAA